MYEWDPAKAVANRAKHGVGFPDAVGVFEDPLALTVPEIRRGEERFATIGRDLTDALMVVVWTWRGERLRRISARRPTRRERLQYQEGGHA